MITEDRKFLDLDHVCDQILSQDDRTMFTEAIRCYQIGSHRAAIILAWCVTADCLYRRIDELASEGDGVAQQARTELQPVIGLVHYEENLIVQARKCELYDEYEEKCLRFVRDTRSKCAHPTGVIPSAEAVRNILHICSQVVLCREGFRGMSYVKHFVQIKLDNSHLFADKNRTTEACNYYFGKVSERIRPQFASCASEHLRNGCSATWKTNSFVFFKELLSNSADDLAKKISQKFQPIEGLDPMFYSVLLGLDQRVHLWDIHARGQARGHLRDLLKSGKVDPFAFLAYANLSSFDEFEEPDKLLFMQRLSVFSEQISQHDLLQANRRKEILDLILEGLTDTTFEQQILKAIKHLFSANLFAQERHEISLIIDAIIQKDWRDDAVRQLFLYASDWTEALQIQFLKKINNYLLECSGDSSDDVMLVFDLADRILEATPDLLPIQFEEIVKRLINDEIQMGWYEQKGEAWSTFIGQVSVIASRYGAHLPIISALTLPTLDEPDELGGPDD